MLQICSPNTEVLTNNFLTTNLPPWCKCGGCEVWTGQTRDEERCCLIQSGKCVLTLNTIQTVVFNEAVVKAAINNFRLLTAMSTANVFDNKSMRHQAYKQFVAHTVGTTGKGVRMIVPACVVSAIRKKWPEADGNYIGFKMSNVSGHKELEFHCDRQPVDEFDYEDDDDDDE